MILDGVDLSRESWDLLFELDEEEAKVRQELELSLLFQAEFCLPSAAKHLQEHYKWSLLLLQWDINRNIHIPLHSSIY